MSQPFLSPIVGSNNQKIRLFEVQFAREGMHMQCCDQFRGIEHVKVRKWALRGNLCLEGAMSTMMAFISAIFFFTGNEDPLRRILMDSTQFYSFVPNSIPLYSKVKESKKVGDSTAYFINPMYLANDLQRCQYPPRVADIRQLLWSTWLNY